MLQTWKKLTRSKILRTLLFQNYNTWKNCLLNSQSYWLFDKSQVNHDMTDPPRSFPRLNFNLARDGCF